MGKSTVLKDLSNHPAGYVLVSRESVTCRTQLNEPAQLAVVLADGSHLTFDLDTRKQEQHFPCEDVQMRGCYVFQGDALLLVSDEAMRGIFERNAFSRTRESANQSEGPSPKERPILVVGNDELTQRENREESTYTFAQRRWPPPACWDMARYRGGRWQEE